MPTAPLSVQLYSLRTEAASDFEGVLRTVAEIGYLGVEPAGLHGMAPGHFRDVVVDCGLVVSSAHVTLPLGDGADATFDEQEAIGNSVLISSGTPADFATADDVRRIAERFNEAAEAAAPRGMSVGYHNHGWEFAALPDGRSPYDLLQASLDPAVFLEIDLYWVRVGGADPAAVVADAGARARFLHVKDGPLDPPAPMSACGDGAMDLAAPIDAAAFAEWHVVELDSCATDMTEAVRRSHRYLVDSGLSTGR